MHGLFPLRPRNPKEPSGWLSERRVTPLSDWARCRTAHGAKKERRETLIGKDKERSSAPVGRFGVLYGHWLSAGGQGVPHCGYALDLLAEESLNKYYERVRVHLAEKYPDASEHVLDHLEVLEAFLDKSILSGVTFGIEKASII